jgi:hypothetical protein
MFVFVSMFSVLQSKCVQQLEADNIKAKLEIQSQTVHGCPVTSANPLSVKAYIPSTSPSVPNSQRTNVQLSEMRAVPYCEVVGAINWVVVVM